MESDSQLSCAPASTQTREYPLPALLYYVAACNSYMTCEPNEAHCLLTHLKKVAQRRGKTCQFLTFNSDLELHTYTVDAVVWSIRGILKHLLVCCRWQNNLITVTTAQIKKMVRLDFALKQKRPSAVGQPKICCFRTLWFFLVIILTKCSCVITERKPQVLQSQGLWPNTTVMSEVQRLFFCTMTFNKLKANRSHPRGYLPLITDRRTDSLDW